MIMPPNLYLAPRAGPPNFQPTAISLPNSRPRVFFVVEGINDIQFLRRISTILHEDDPSLPSLSDMERSGELIFVPFGGGDVSLWTNRLEVLGRAELHLYDREMPPETESRQRVADAVNARPLCRAFVTQKRCLENYLSPDAIREASGLNVVFSDDDSVVELVAQQMHARRDEQPLWKDLPARLRKRRRHRVKLWLNTRAVEHMTPKRLAERDSDGELRGWLEILRQMAKGA